MEERLARIQQLMASLMEELLGAMNDMLGGVLDPAVIMQLMRNSGIDISQLSGMVGQQPGFDPYRIIGLDRSAGDEEVKKRYRELLRKLHPDTSGTPGTSFLLQMVMTAFETIKKERGWQ
jgi:DnaJ-domain-containing protein 1